jgi:predicted PurR-regulated permease PerM
MTTKEGQGTASALVGPFTVEAVVRLGLLALLAYWALQVIGPFLTIGLWSAILTVALYPTFAWLARRLGRPRTAATLLTLLCVLIVIGPVTWLGVSLIGGANFVVRALQAKTLSIPLPADSVKSWPLVGERIYHLWTLAATDTKAMLAQVLPRLQPVGGKLLNVAGAVVVGLLEFIASIVIAGFLFVPGPRLAESLRASLRRVFGPRSEEMMKIAGSTIRNVSRGVVGVSLMQALLAGLGFLVAGIPAAGFLTLGVLVLGIIQVGSGPILLPVVVWSWFKLKTTTALVLTIYLVPVGLIDNVLKPIVMAHGLAAPMAIILVGVIGGTIVFGVSGLFLGPIVLSVAWALVAAWVQETVKDAESGEEPPPK